MISEEQLQKWLEDYGPDGAAPCEVVALLVEEVRKLRSEFCVPVQLLPKCGWPGCEYHADPRWYVHLPSGAVHACDGHGCLGGDGCKCIERLAKKKRRG
jgi:hypothetical protein